MREPTPELRPLPVGRKAGESLRGLVLRLAEGESCNSDEMRGWLSLPLGDRPLLGPFTHAAALLEMTETELEEMGGETSGSVYIAGTVVPSSLRLRGRMQVCPACLADDSFHRSVWEFNRLNVCPLHRTKLVDRCPDNECGALQTWSRWNLATCACGTDLRGPGVKAEGTCLAATVVFRGLGLPVDGPELPKIFQGLPVADLIDLMAFLGRSELVIGRGNPFGLRAKAMSSDARVMDAGAAILLGWPTTFDHLAELVSLSRSGYSGLARFGYLHRFIATSGDRSFGALLRDAYRNFLITGHGMKVKELPDFLAVRRDDSAYVTSGQASRMLGMTPEMIARLKGTHLWKDVETRAINRGGQRLVPRVQIESIIARIARLIPFREAGHLLGLPKHGTHTGVARLVEWGLLEAFPYNLGRGADENSVERGSVEAMAAIIAAKTTDVEPDDKVSFADLFISLSKHPTIKPPMAELFNALMAGQLCGFVSNSQALGVQRLTFERRDTERVVAAILTAQRAAMVPMEEAARLLGLRTPVIHGLLLAEFLPAATRHGTTYMLDRGAIDAFRERFESSGQIAARWGRKPFTVEAILQSEGIVPAVVVPVSGRNGVAFYRRDVGLGLRAVGGSAATKA